MVDRPCLQDRFCGFEDCFHLPQLPVGKGNRQSRKLAVGAQHVEPVEARVFSNARSVDLEMPCVRCGEKPAITGVADELLVALLQLRLQAVEDGGTSGGVTLCLLGIEADHVATWL